MAIFIVLLLLIGIYVIITSEENSKEAVASEGEEHQYDQDTIRENSYTEIINESTKDISEDINVDKFDLIVADTANQYPTLEDLALDKVSEEDEINESIVELNVKENDDSNRRFYYFSDFDISNNSLNSDNLLPEPQQYSYFVFNQFTEDKAQYFLYEDPLNKENAINAFAYVIEPVCEIEGDFVPNFSTIEVVKPGLLMKRANKWIIIEKCVINIK